MPHARVVAEIAQLRAEAQEVQRADTALSQAMQQARRLVQPVPAVLAAAAEDLPSRQTAHDHWARWAEALSVATPEALAGHLEAHALELPEAVRSLGIRAAIVNVTRRARSVVEVRQARDPVSGHLDDARALIKTDGLPGGVAARVVPGFCRLALEAACMEAARRRRLRRGDRHDDVEELLAEHSTLYPLMALALVDDGAKTSEVLPRLAKLGSWAPDAFKGCNRGAHEAYDGDLDALVRSTEQLAGRVRGLVA